MPCGRRTTELPAVDGLLEAGLGGLALAESMSWAER